MRRRKMEIHAIINHYLDTTKKSEWKMEEIAQWAADHGWPLPQPKTPLELLAQEFSRAAREVVRKDGKTGRSYRAYHAFKPDGQQLTFWVDIDKAPRKYMHKSAIQRREQVVGDVVQLYLDLEHWNRVNPREEPIVMPTDYTDDVNWRLAAPDEGEQSA
jgi:hypothetical protein